MQANPSADRYASTAGATSAVRRLPARRPWALWLIIIICALPFTLAAALYFAPVWVGYVPGAERVVDSLLPDGKTNYGALIEPQRPLHAFPAQDLDGRAVDLRALRGRWVMVAIASDACDADCMAQLYLMRQVRTSMGKDRVRVERVLILTGAAQLDAATRADYAGTTIVRAQPGDVQAWIGVPAPAMLGATYLIDPLGNLMLRWPVQAQPVKVRKDLSRLLWASSIG